MSKKKVSVSFFFFSSHLMMSFMRLTLVEVSFGEDF